MKKYLLSLITLTFFLCEASFTGGGMAFANNAVGDSWNDGNFTYTVTTAAPSTSSAGKVSVKAKSGASISGALSLSSQVSHKFTLFGSTYNYDVTEIAANGFQNKTGITSLSIAGSVVTIGNYAFDGCTNISGTVSIPAATQTVGNYAFRNCSSITEFNYSYYTSGDYTNKRRLTSVGQYAYDGCSNASFVGIWSDKTAYLTSIGNYAFRGCTSMTSVSVPASVTSIGTSAFEGCTSLTTITFNGTGVTSWPASMCKGCTSLSKIGTGSVTAGRVAVYNAVTSIGSSAFEGCTSINSVVFSGTNVTTLAASVFKGCTSLTQMGNSAGYFTIPNSITTINESAFANCTGITKLTIGTGVITLNSAAFTGCTNISTVTWNATNCTSSYNSTANPFSASKDKITSFTFGSSVTRIPAFLCYQLTEITSVTIPQSVTFAGGGAFGGCSKLTNVVWNAANCADFTRSYSSEIPTYSSPFCQGAASGTLIKASNLTTITFGSNVTKVPADMCIECKNLKVVTWEAGSATIGSSAFSGCNALKSIIWNKTNCADFASASVTPFYFIRTQIESFTFKNNVTHIPAYLCDGMTKLKQVSLPSTVTTVGANAFNGCTGMEAFACAKTTAPTAAASSFTDVPCCLTVPTDSWDSYKDATGWSHFNNAGCSNAPSDIVRGTCGAQGKNLVWELNLASGEMTISGTGEMANYTNSTGNHAPWYDDYRLLIKNVTIEEGATSIGDYAFHNCRNTTFSTLPKSLIKIGKEAFYYCYTANEINFAENSELTTIGKWAFDYCTLLVHITIPEEVIKFDANDAFTGCNALTSVTWNARNCPDFSSSTTGPFNSKNTNIQSFEFGPAVEHIPSYLCSGMSNTAFTSINIPESVTSIGANAFYGCTSLTDITWKAVHCGDFSSYSVAPFYEHRANIQSVSFGDAVEYIPARLCYGLNNASFTLVTIPASVTTIATSAFENCTGLTSVNMRGADNLETIAYSAFDGCSNVAGEIYIPASVTSVSGYIFNDFSKVTSMYVMPTSVPTGATSTSFTNMVKTIPVYFASTDYTTANYWKDFTNYTCSGYCGAEEGGLNLTWTYTNSNNTLTISGTGAMQTFGSAGVVPWSSFRSAIKAIVIESGVTTIGNYAFYGCNNEFFTSISIPEGVTSLGNSVFQNCTYLASVTLPSTLGSIGSSAFHSNAFTSISIPSSVSTISSYAFKNCANLTSIVVPNITILNEETFYGCSSLGSVTLPNTLTSIKKNTFVNCSSLTSITIPENVAEIVCVQGSGSATCPFSGCTSLTSVVWNARACGGFSRVGQYQEYAMPFESIKTNINSFTFGENVTSIPSYVCHGMTGLESITIPASVTTIGANAFDGCTGLETVTSNATSVPSIASSTFPTAVEDAATLYVPATVAVRTAYSNDTYWSEFDHMLPYVLTFNLQDHGETIDPICVNAGRVDEALKPADPTETGYTFGGWFSNEGCTTPFTFGESGTVVNGDLTLYAKWTINSYDVTFDLQGHGAPIAPQSIDYNGTVTVPSPAPSEDNYTFGGWFKEAGCDNAWDFGEDKVTDDLILYAKWTLNGLVLNENANNASLIAAYYNQTTNVSITRSKLTNESYNTFCLPFALSDAQLQEIFGAGYDLREFESSSLDGEVLNLVFSDPLNTLEAGKPYLLKPANEVTNPSFEGVTIAATSPVDNTSDANIEFHGVYSPTELAGGNKNLLFLGAGNELFWPESTGNIKGFRAYFVVKGSAAKSAKRARIVKKEDTATGIETITNDQSPITNKIIKDNQLLILRDGKTYNAQGMRVE